MAEKKAPRLTPEQNEARQAARAAKRERAKDARLIAQLAVHLFTDDRGERTVYDSVNRAKSFLDEARKQVG